MKRHIAKLVMDNRNYYFYPSNVIKKIPKYLIPRNKEFRLLYVSNDFSKYSIEEVEKNIECIISQKGLHEIDFFGGSGSRLQEIVENTIVNRGMEEKNKKILSVVSISENNLREEGFLWAFVHGGLSMNDTDAYITENFCIYDNDDLYRYIMNLMN